MSTDLRMVVNMYIEDMLENNMIFFKMNIHKIFIIIMILILGISILLKQFIEFKTLNYYVSNEKGEKLNATVISKNDYIRVEFTDLSNPNFITIVTTEKIIGVNEIEPINLFQSIYFFNDNSKKIGYTDGVFDLDITKDTIKFNTFIHNKMNLKGLGDEILIVRKN